MVKNREVLVMSVRSKIASLVGLDEALTQLQKDWVVSPYNLIQSAISKGFITLDEVTKTLWQEAILESEEIDSYYADSGEGIGSSDMNAFISNMLNASGIKVVVKDNKYVRL
jgi:anaerobic ribonucleoside-triphosphate reductase